MFRRGVPLADRLTERHYASNTVRTLHFMTASGVRGRIGAAMNDIVDPALCAG
jgi:hypothetical protein